MAHEASGVCRGGWRPDQERRRLAQVGGGATRTGLSAVPQSTPLRGPLCGRLLLIATHPRRRSRSTAKSTTSWRGTRRPTTLRSAPNGLKCNMLSMCCHCSAVLISCVIRWSGRLRRPGSGNSRPSARSADPQPRTHACSMRARFSLRRSRAPADGALFVHSLLGAAAAECISPRASSCPSPASPPFLPLPPWPPCAMCDALPGS